MSYTTLIDAATVAANLGHPQWAIVDCRYQLNDPEWGRRSFLEAHIPGASYAHLHDDLAGGRTSDNAGRHPLPSVQDAARKFAIWGIGPGFQVVAYDDRDGSMAAARLWWMLRWLGHDAVAVLDGGWQAWLAGGYPTAAGNQAVQPQSFVARPNPDMLADAEEVQRLAQDPDYRVVDVRTGERYRGETEPIDPVAGHVPGAVNLPHAGNVGPDGRFLPPEEMRARFESALGDVYGGRSIYYCGSGVSASQSLLAMAHAGLPLGRLYAGSWSDWITRDGYPVATGDEQR